VADDSAIRKAAFEYVNAVTEGGEHPISWKQLQGFQFEGRQIHLVSQQGIFKPAALDLPISIRTTSPSADGSRPYEDEISDDGMLCYKYRGTDPNHRENILLRRAMESGTPLLYLQGIAKGIYDASGAAIIEDDPGRLAFGVALFPLAAATVGLGVDLDSMQRRYYLAEVKRRANQQSFRHSVLRAYRTQCAICRLRHEELLDAAHIVADAAGGQPVVTNGLSMCKIHHAAFDHNIVGVRPDMVAEVRTDVLAEVDGPMLEHGIQGIHGRRLIVPSQDRWRPDPAALEQRYEEFREAG
jgi:putative restriction endonuclease